MRYTTLVDLRDIPEVYRNQNVRLLYLHLVLIAGYHDDDRDIVRVSLRALAAQTGLTLSATRHAVAVLIKWRLLQHRKSYFKVVKFIEEKEITPRAKTRKQQQQQQARQQQRQDQTEQESKESQDREELASIYDKNKTPFMVWYEEKMILAAQGDNDAIRIVKEKRQQYEAHKSNLKKQSL